jgi:hypothetical protein
MKYWKLVLRYGHVGLRNEVSVARFIETDLSVSILSVWSLASNMPGVKNKGVLSIKQIDYKEYICGKNEEAENLFLQKLMTKNIRAHEPKKIA